MRLITAAQLGDILGVTDKTVNRWCHSGILMDHAHAVGGRWVIVWSEELLMLAPAVSAQRNQGEIEIRLRQYTRKFVRRARTKYDWASVDWSLTSGEIAARLGTSSGTVSKYRWKNKMPASGRRASIRPKASMARASRVQRALFREALKESVL